MGFEIQKAGVWKRASAFLLDVILLSILAVGFLTLLSAVTGYDTKAQLLEDRYTAYSEAYDTDLNMSEEAYNSLPKEAQERFMAAYKALTEDGEAQETYRQVVMLSLLILSLSIFLAFALLEFLMPLLLKEGRTLGKKVFGLCVVHTNCVRMEPGAVFIRSMLGKCTIETMVPALVLVMLYFDVVGLAGTLLLAALGMTQLILLIATRNNQPIHDLLAQSAVADYQSQPVFFVKRAVQPPPGARRSVFGCELADGNEAGAEPDPDEFRILNEGEPDQAVLDGIHQIDGIAGLFRCQMEFLLHFHVYEQISHTVSGTFHFPVGVGVVFQNVKILHVEV